MSLHGRVSVRPLRSRDDGGRHSPKISNQANEVISDEDDSHGKRTRFSPSQLLSLFSALAYGFASLAMVFLNKGVLMQYKFSITLLTMQMLVSAGLIQLAGWLKLFPVRPLDMKTSRRLLPLSLFYNANVAFALASLNGINIPMYIALKRLTPMAVLIAGHFRGKQKPPLQVTLSVLLIAVGCTIAALGDFSFDLLGYAMALASVFFQTGYLVLVEQTGAEDGLSSTELMLYNAVLSLPILSAILIFSGEAAVSIPELILQCSKSSIFFFAVVSSLLMGILLNYTMFLCTLKNSALTTTIVGVLKGVVSTALGFFVLGGVPMRALNVTGLVINSCGGVWYSYAKYTQKAKQSKQVSEAQEPLLPTSVPPRTVVVSH